MKTNIDLDEFIPTMDAPDKVYQLFNSLGFKVLDSHLKTNPSVYNLPVKEAALVEKIYAVSNYDRRFQIFLFKLKGENKEVIRSIPEKILREVDFPFIIFTPDFKTYTFTLVEKVREGPGEFKRKLTKLIIDRTQPYHTDKEILRSLALSKDIKNPVEIYKLFQNAFSVEKVTKKFFIEYQKAFGKLSEDITKQNEHLRFNLFAREGSIENFTKILLGRLMFLYFIQKKGWLNCFDGWGSGDKKFLYNKFQEAEKEKKNYFKDYLEPLFFEVLNTPVRNEADNSTIFGGRIPFLNGGLFEPNYKYKNPSETVFINNESFEQVFSVFEKYNFTVKEDEPLEKEVAIDPEMLGKVFENLLKENLRKGKGTYYTPREIVHYMCHESLINYLASKTVIDTDQIRSFLDREQSLEKKETLSPAIRQKAKEIDEKLVNIKVLDPACGSGAFLVGMLHEVVNARLSLNRELGRSFSEYELKKATIQNNIYGVDIDPGAAEIAKLRLWLTLVVDHNLSEIEPLPNLDYKIMVGNSLIEDVFINGKSIKLFNYEFFRKKQGKKMKNLFEEETKVELFDYLRWENIQPEVEQIIKKKKLLFDTFEFEKKQKLRREIDDLENELIRKSLRHEAQLLKDRIQYDRRRSDLKTDKQNKELLDTQFSKSFLDELINNDEKLNEYKSSNLFLWKLRFIEVFDEKDGFDVVIANPPYMKERDNKKIFDIVNNSGFGKKYQQGKMDYWFYFLHKAIDLVKTDGVICYITSRYWLNSTGAKKLIERVKNELSFINFVDIGKLKVFDNVVGQHMIALYLRGKGRKSFVYKKLENDLSDLSKNTNTDNLKVSIYDNEEVFNDSQIILDKDSIDYSNFDQLGEIAEVIQGIVQNPDKVSSKIASKYGLTQGESVFVLEENELLRINLSKKEMKYVKDFYDESDIQRYAISPKQKKYLLYLTKRNCPDISLYPNIEKHLRKYKKIMDARRETVNGSNKWFHLHWPREEKYFKNYKVVMPAMFYKTKAAYQEKEGYFGLSTNVIVSKNENYDLKFILSILNSRFANYWFYKHGKSRGVGVDVGVNRLKEFPIKYSSLPEQQQFIDIVNKILTTTKDKNYLDNVLKQAKVRDYEKQIDQLVYKLYELTTEEIAVVEGDISF